MVKQIKKDINNQQTIGYRGSVKISLIKDGKIKKVIKTHNAGTQYLFQLLTCAITGLDISSDIPQYIDLLDSNNHSILSYKPSLTGVTIENTSSSNKAIFTAYIPQSAISAATHVYRTIKLYSRSSDDSTELASLTLEDDTTIPDDYAVMIQWSMSFTNL